MEPFKLERFFAAYEFTTKYLLCASDCESLTMAETLEMADPQMQAAWSSLKLAYTDSVGYLPLREAAAAMYPGLSPDQVLVVAPEEGIYIAMRTLLKPGDHVISTFPGYQSLYELGRGIGCEVTPWHARETETGWTFDLNELQEMLQPRTRMLIVNFPHNPTGFLPDHAFFQEMLGLVARNGAYLFCDEMYRQLENNPADRLPSACTQYPFAITLSGMSKAFAQPGLRIGWLATQDREAFRAFTYYKDYTTICASAPSEILATIGLRNGEVIAARNRAIIKANQDLARDLFSRFPQVFKWLEPQGSSVAFPRLLLSESVEAFSKDLVQQKEVLLAPGRMFEVPSNHFRIGFGRRNFGQGLELLEEFLNEAGYRY